MEIDGGGAAPPPTAPNPLAGSALALHQPPSTAPSLIVTGRHQPSPLPDGATASSHGGAWSLSTGGLSFAQVLLKDTAPPVIQVVPHPPETMDSGEPLASFSSEELQRSLEPLAFTVMVKTPQGRPPFPDIRAHLAQRFRFKNDFVISAYDIRHLLIRFGNREDYLKLLLKEAMLVHGKPFRFIQWDHEFTPEADSPVVPVWLELPRLPANFFCEPMLRSIAGSIGPVLQIGQSTLNLTKTHAAQVCVQLDMSKKLHERVRINYPSGGFWQPIAYPNAPSFCSSCNRLGHVESQCRQRDGYGDGRQSGIPTRNQAVDASQSIPIKGNAPRNRNSDKGDGQPSLPHTSVPPPDGLKEWRPAPHKNTASGARLPSSSAANGKHQQALGVPATRPVESEIGPALAPQFSASFEAPQQISNMNSDANKHPFEAVKRGPRPSAQGITLSIPNRDHSQPCGAPVLHGATPVLTHKLPAAPRTQVPVFNAFQVLEGLTEDAQGTNVELARDCSLAHSSEDALYPVGLLTSGSHGIPPEVQLHVEEQHTMRSPGRSNMPDAKSTWRGHNQYSSAMAPRPAKGAALETSLYRSTHNEASTSCQVPTASTEEEQVNHEVQEHVGYPSQDGDVHIGAGPHEVLLTAATKPCVHNVLEEMPIPPLVTLVQEGLASNDSLHASTMGAAGARQVSVGINVETGASRPPTIQPHAPPPDACRVLNNMPTRDSEFVPSTEAHAAVGEMPTGPPVGAPGSPTIHSHLKSKTPTAIAPQVSATMPHRPVKPKGKAIDIQNRGLASIMSSDLLQAMSLTTSTPQLTEGMLCDPSTADNAGDNAAVNSHQLAGSSDTQVPSSSQPLNPNEQDELSLDNPSNVKDFVYESNNPQEQDTLHRDRSGVKVPGDEFIVALPVTYDILHFPGVPPATEDEIGAAHVAFVGDAKLKHKHRKKSDSHRSGTADDQATNYKALQPHEIEAEIPNDAKISMPAHDETDAATPRNVGVDEVLDNMPSPPAAAHTSMNDTSAHSYSQVVQKTPTKGAAATKDQEVVGGKHRKKSKGVVIRSGKIKTKNVGHRSTSPDFYNYDDYDEDFYL